VPVESYQVPSGLNPSISLIYNNLAGNGRLGVGWNIGGLSAISRTNKSFYYDAKSRGVDEEYPSPSTATFALDGLRLIKISESSSKITYQTEENNIKVVATIGKVLYLSALGINVYVA
jgi:hypothetical protein